MYRRPKGDSFSYDCGLYQQSHGAQCHRNYVDGMAASRFVLGCVRQRLLTPGFRCKLEERLRALAKRDQHDEGIDREIETIRAALTEVTRRRELVARNLALAADPIQHRAIAKVFDEIVQEQKALELKLQHAAGSITKRPDLEADISAALADFDRLADLANDPSNLEVIGKLFQQVNARLFLHFKEVQPKKRKLNKVAGGVVTFGASPPPVNLYLGPTGRRTLGSTADTPHSMTVVAAVPPVPCGSVREGKSLGNVNRAERI
jgi:hypothetical protein